MPQVEYIIVEEDEMRFEVWKMTNTCPDCDEMLGVFYSREEAEKYVQSLHKRG
jgi:uncharacterized protein YbdZ (MbtH family)